MSDGSLSQEEIDALLQGIPSFDSKSAAAKKAPPASQIKDEFESIPRKIQNEYVKNLETLTGVSVTLKGIEVAEADSESILTKLPDEVVYFNASFSGFETRKILFSKAALENSSAAISKAIEFEISWLKYKGNNQERIKKLQKRLDLSTVQKI